MHAMHTYQILNHYTSRQELDPGFEVLDNSSNERPDWYEYWPIRKFLQNEALDENAFYGFLSPKFNLRPKRIGLGFHGRKYWICLWHRILRDIWQRLALD